MKGPDTSEWDITDWVAILFTLVILLMALATIGGAFYLAHQEQKLCFESTDVDCTEEDD